MTPDDDGVSMRDVYILTMPDGTLLHCEPRLFRPTDKFRHWSIHTTTMQYVGPIVLPERDPETVRETIEDWWRSMKELGYGPDCERGVK